MVSWNTQALFAADPMKHASKSKQVHKLMATHDVGGWTETHGAKDGNNTWRNPDGCTSWWSPGPTPGVAGVGLTVKNVFLDKFSHTRKWEIILPGRAAVLRLSGKHGALDLFIVYFHTGVHVFPQDLKDAGLNVQEQHVTSAHLREALRHRISRKIRPQDQTLSFLMGDFNYVMDPADRICLDTTAVTGTRDRHEAQQWRSLVESRHNVHELYQPEMTYASPNSRSRIDRFYCNQYEVEYMDRSFACTALSWDPALSRHRPISFRKQIPEFRSHLNKPIPDEVLEHGDWPRQVSLAWHDLLREHPDAAPVHKLQLLKKSMRIAEKNMNKIGGAPPPPEGLEDRIGIAIKFIRASEAECPDRISACLLRYPSLQNLIDNPYDFRAPVGVRLRKMRNHVMELAKEHTLEELNALHADLKNLSPEQTSRRRARNHQLVCRLAPGRSCKTFAVSDPSGSSTTDPFQMAEILKKHWAEVFKKKATAPEVRKKWLEEDADEHPFYNMQCVPRSFVPLKTFRRAIAVTGNSAPGKDGITFKAWRKIGGLAAKVFHDMFMSLASGDGIEHIMTDWQAFNESIMVFLPKKVSSTRADGTDVYSPKNLRPLNITNTDNRIFCSAVRLHIEPIIAPGISLSQRGFIKFRSMLSNAVDVDEAMIDAAMKEDNPAAILFDFEAAFPSIDHDFIFDVIASRGWPQWLIKIIRLLYWNNSCCMSLGGVYCDGFNITAGVRQGCPLSPLLFAFTSDVLLRKLARQVPTAVIRAYADDIAIVLRKCHNNIGVLEHIFYEYGVIAGLRLNHGKCVWIPLTLKSKEESRQELSDFAPSWSCFSIEGHATYLGFAVGPNRGQHSWDKALQKMLDRARVWRAIGCGMLISINAYRMYIFPLACFLLQLENLPPAWSNIERQLCTSLFPGPRGWMIPQVLCSLKDLGFPAELPDATAISTASKCRVFRWENLAYGGLNVKKRHIALEATIADTEWINRRTVWASWLGNNFLRNLFHAWGHFESTASKQQLSPDQLLRKSGEDEVPKEVWQKRCMAVLRTSHDVPLHRHLRRRLDEWKISVLPGHRVHRASNMLDGLIRFVSPRIWAAILRTLCDGWTTHRRMQRHAPCLFGCGFGEDSIVHYASCSVLSNLMWRKLKLDRLPIENQLAGFLLLEPYWKEGREEEVSRRALGVYATFMACNIVRNGGALCTADVWLQCMKEGAASSKKLSVILNQLWT